MLVNVFLCLFHRGNRSVACFCECRKTFGGQLLLCCIRQRAIKEAPCSRKLLRASDAVQMPWMADQRVARGNVRGCVFQPIDNLLPSCLGVSLTSTLAAGDGQVKKLRVNRPHDCQRRRRWIFLVGFVHQILSLISSELGAQQFGIVHLHERRAI